VDQARRSLPWSYSSAGADNINGALDRLERDLSEVRR